ncbi:TolC family outer membrane protein [Methylomonas sp. UP202]|uniref:TolC family outer membrane protein n=1 Tax=Methylomonas sp. UP202 TaxID=3040943 RepID=UPI002478F85D|nr:TolC family outer membrane protein [Methylomonas sp. UP202]WGS85601.1 TolC family outer membrane protein [Methylomonas sp. UP202]
MRSTKLILLGLAVTLAGRACADDLLTVYQQALQAAPSLKSADVKVDIGAAQTGQALGQMLPQVTGTANWSENRLNVRNSDLSYSGTRYYLSLNQTLIDFAKFWTWRRARVAESQYELERTDVSNLLMFSVVERYFGVLEAEDQLRFIQTEKLAIQQQLQQVQKRFAKQLVKITDVYEVEAQLDKIEADQIEAESLVSSAKQNLRELTNQEPDSLLTLRENIEYKELEGKLDDWIAVATNDNPALAAQQKAIEAADNDLVAQKSRHLPVVDLQLNYYDTNTGYQSTLLSNQTQTQVAAINVNVPIFSGGTTMHQVREAESRLALNRHAEEEKLRTVVKETSDAFLTSNANVRRIKASIKALESAQKSHDAMQSAYKYGVATIGDVLVAQQTEFRARRDLLQSKYAYIKNRFRFLQAIGAISEENLQEVNTWLEKPVQASSVLNPEK